MNRIRNEEDFKVLSKNLKDAFLSLHKKMPDWGTKQNNIQDRKSSIIYNIDSLEELEATPEFINSSEDQKSYYIRRWFNHKWALCDEYLFGICQNCEPNPNYRDKSYDVNIGGCKVDVKGSVIPKRIPGDRSVSRFIEHPEELSDWMYKNQSQEGRFGLQNRLFVIHTSYRDADRTRFAFGSKRKIFKEMCENIGKVSKFPYTENGITCYGMLVFVMEESDGIHYFIPGVTESVKKA